MKNLTMLALLDASPKQRKGLKEETTRVKGYLNDALRVGSETGLRNSVKLYTIPLLEKFEEVLS